MMEHARKTFSESQQFFPKAKKQAEDDDLTTPKVAGNNKPLATSATAKNLIIRTGQESKKDVGHLRSIQGKELYFKIAQNQMH